MSVTTIELWWMPVRRMIASSPLDQASKGGQRLAEALPRLLDELEGLLLGLGVRGIDLGDIGDQFTELARDLLAHAVGLVAVHGDAPSARRGSRDGVARGRLPGGPVRPPSPPRARRAASRL